MRESIKYYYDIYPEEIFHLDNGCYFFYDDIKYYFVFYDRDPKEIDFLVKISNDLYNRNVLVDTFISNRNGEFYVVIDSVIYVMLRVNSIESDVYDLSDIVYFNNLIVSNNIRSIDSNWASLWCKKIDDFEEAIGELNLEYPLILESYDYYVGLAENAVSYFLNATMMSDFGSSKLTINHKRIPVKTYSGFINNPLNFTIDYEVRDVAEYIKVKFFNGSINYDEVEDLIMNGNYSSSSLAILFSRLLYPSYYFDTVNLIISLDHSESEVLGYISKCAMYEDFLLDIYNLISKRANIPPVTWLR